MLCECEVYELTQNKGICDGDSGSWVIDSSTFELYGHLVATDMFGGGYVIPMSDVFNDIKRNLDARSVELPDTVDVLHARTVAQEKTAAANTRTSAAVGLDDPRMSPDESEDDGGDDEFLSLFSIQELPPTSILTQRTLPDSGYMPLPTTPPRPAETRSFTSPQDSKHRSNGDTDKPGIDSPITPERGSLLRRFRRS